MQKLTLKFSNLVALNAIQKAIAAEQPLDKGQIATLSFFLQQLPTTEELLIEKTPLDEVFEVDLWIYQKVCDHIERWEALFSNIPGYDYAASCHYVRMDNIPLLKERVVLNATFAPTMAYNLNEENFEGYEIHLKDDGTAVFWLPTLEDAQQYPELYNFKGTWKDAYYLLIETLKKGWPMEEFPEELLPLLKK